MAVPISFANADPSDWLHKLRLAADRYTPSPSTLLKYAAPFIGGPGMYALQGVASGDILNKPAEPSPAPQAPSPTMADPDPTSGFGGAMSPPPPTQLPAVTVSAPSPASNVPPVPMPQPRPSIPTPQAAQITSPPVDYSSSWNGMQFGPTGQIITPQSVTGSDLISKMMGILNKKADD